MYISLTMDPGLDVWYGVVAERMFERWWEYWEEEEDEEFRLRPMKISKSAYRRPTKPRS